ncbi:MAG: undecaprenyl/decaprenyl-phosphate alpha-N-acetylglucosaminyl 1-phosphate transferase, partial [Bacilli bacterium]|nr:undecaprenyl/decaprenyl-phosphate alpha-N-acetylglucosaminyl 1-phosphate transferase [Bacilli bacterium]
LEVNGFNIFEIVLVTFLSSLILVPISKKIAFHINALDYPNERKIHKKIMPRLGGIAIYGSFLLGYILYGSNTPQMLSILIGGFVILVMGIIDDINPIRAKYKFLVHIIASLIVVLYGKIYLTEISFLGLYFSVPAPLCYIVSCLIIVSLINAINLMDGLDGMASGISSIYFLTISIVAFILNRFAGIDIILSLIMLGSTLGFLVYNFPPASTFMGDCGSNFLGFMIAVICLLGFKVTTFTSIIIPLAILALPIIDTALSIFRRLLKGQGIAEPDREHFHHQLLKMKFSPRTSLIIIYMINMLFATVSIFYALGDNKFAIVIYVLLILLLLFIVLRTDILFDHNKNKKLKK